MSNDLYLPARRSDLDTLRAGAMLLGIALHASLSFFPSYWMVTDQRQADVLRTMVAAIHGFRMPLFFVMSGYFSAMLLHRRGRGALVKHRFRRVFLPLLVGMLTIVPLTMWVSGVAMSSAKSSGESASSAPTEIASTIWTAAEAGDLSSVDQHLARGAAVDERDPERGGTPLLWAAAANQAQVLDHLIDLGADINAADPDGGTALHVAAFLGHDQVIKVLLQRGADVNAVNSRGETPLSLATLDEGTTLYFASLLKLAIDEDGLGRRKAAIAESLRQRGATAADMPSLAETLMRLQLFSHLWFLWFLWWLVLGYAAISALGSRLRVAGLPTWLARSPARYLWLIPLTMIPQWFMGDGGTTPSFGPDTSTGLLPVPHVLGYYAVFFGFGALYYGHEDPSSRTGKWWWLPLVIGVVVVLPLGMTLGAGWTGPASLPFSPRFQRVLAVFTQAAYPWLITFGLMGLMRRICPVDSPRMRYLSDSAYWLYLVHLPLVIGAQFLVRDWPIPALAKFALIIIVSTALLLLSYQFLVRYTWIGRFLNGPRVRPQPVLAASSAV